MDTTIKRRGRPMKYANKEESILVAKAQRKAYNKSAYQATKTEKQIQRLEAKLMKLKTSTLKNYA